MIEKAPRKSTTIPCVTDLTDPFVNAVTRARDARAYTADKGEPVTSVTHAEVVDSARVKVAYGCRPILALDFGQRTGWASRNHDGAISSGVQEFRHGRFEDGMTMAQVIGGAR